MQPGRARTSGLGVPRLLPARWVGWVAPVRPTHGVLVLPCPSAALPVHVCAVSWATWLLFTGVRAWCVVLLVRCPGPLGSCSPMTPLGVLCCLCAVLGHLAPVHRCARSVRCFVCAVSWATWLLFTCVPARCVACVCGVLGHLAPVHRCARSMRCFACAVSWATWLLFTGVPAWFVVLRVRCPGPLGSCSPVCLLGVLFFCLCGVLSYLAPAHRCTGSVRCFACAVSWATWLLLTGVPAWLVVLCVRCPGPLGSCSPVCPLGALPVCAVSWATWLLFTAVPAWCVVLVVWGPGSLGSWSPVCPLGALLCVCGVLGHLAPVHLCARSVRCLCVRCPGPLATCSSVCPLNALLCVCCVLGHLAPVHRCARVVCCVACTVSWATWLLFTGVPARCVVFLLVRCPELLGSCSPVYWLGALLCVCGVLGHLAPAHRCSRVVGCVVCAVSWATWLLFIGVLARCVGPVCGVLGHLAPVHRCARLVRCLCVPCPGPLGSCSPLCLLGALFWLCGDLGHLAPGHRCARSVRCFASAVSWATWLLFTGVPARFVVLRVRCPGPQWLQQSLGTVQRPPKVATEHQIDNILSPNTLSTGHTPPGCHPVRTHHC